MLLPLGHIFQFSTLLNKFEILQYNRETQHEMSVTGIHSTKGWHQPLCPGRLPLSRCLQSHCWWWTCWGWGCGGSERGFGSAPCRLLWWSRPRRWLSPASQTSPVERESVSWEDPGISKVKGQKRSSWKKVKKKTNPPLNYNNVLFKVFCPYTFWKYIQCTEGFLKAHYF